MITLPYHPLHEHINRVFTAEVSPMRITSGRTETGDH